LVLLERDFKFVELLQFMIALATLKYLSGQKLKDAEILFHNNRNAGAVYLMGYALELSFKRKICQTLGFMNGFPETTTDFSSYAVQINSFIMNTGASLTQLRQIKNHDLNMLLLFSGTQSIIGTLYAKDWLRVKDWNPEMRYKRHYVSKVDAEKYLAAAKKILKEIV
jgi:hypothetical protein